MNGANPHLLTERTWLTKLAKNLIAEGWRQLAIKLWPARLVLFKRVNQIFLTLAIETSKSDGPKVTASFYLAPSFSWPLAGGDFPPQAYLRVGELLSHDEYPHLGLPPPISSEDIDAWWPEYNERSLKGITDAIRLTEPRFLQQDGIEGLAMNCERLQQHLTLVRKVISLSAGGEGAATMVPMVPQKTKIDPSVPISWYHVAAGVLAERGECPTSEKVKFIAEDAWCINEARGGK